MFPDLVDSPGPHPPTEAQEAPTNQEVIESWTHRRIVQSSQPEVVTSVLPVWSAQKWITAIWTMCGAVQQGPQGHYSLRVVTGMLPCLTYFHSAMDGVGKVSARTWSVGSAKGVAEAATRLLVILPKEGLLRMELRSALEEAQARPPRRMPWQH